MVVGPGEMVSYPAEIIVLIRSKPESTSPKGASDDPLIERPSQSSLGAITDTTKVLVEISVDKCYHHFMTDTDDGYDAVRAAYPPILNTAQVAELLDLNSRTVLNMAGDGRLPASRLPGSRKFHFVLDDVIETLKANRVN